MIEDLKRYEGYRGSAEAWPGRVPSHWNLRPAFGAFEPIHERNKGMKEKRVLSLSYGRIVIKPSEKLRGLVPESFETYQVVNPGDTVLRTTDLQNDRTSLRVGFVRDRGIITSAYLALKPKSGVQPEYGYHVLNAWDISKAIYGYGSGLRQSLDFSHFKRMLVPVPPPEEQAAIVRFLDHANRRMDQFIRAKRKLLTLLIEQKQAIIHRAVTGAFNAGEEFVERGVFLGRLPKRWPLRRAKYLFHQVVAPVPDNAEQVTCFRDGQVTLRRNRRTTGFTEAIYELGYQGISNGQLVVHSMDGFAGAIGVSDSSGKCSPEYVVLEPSTDGIHSEYYALLLRHLALRGLFTALCPSVRERAPRVRFSDFGAFLLPKPTLEEQQAVVDHVREAGGEIDRALRNVRDQLARAQEYRSRLITDVVTGEWDVRGAVLSLDEDVDTSVVGGTSESLVAASDDLADGEAA
jgi:type I restriction enzyme S subunit